MGRILIETYAIFSSDLDDEKLSVEEIERYNFYLDNVISYNSISDNTTCIDLVNGIRRVIAIDFCTFDELIKSHSDTTAIYIANKEIEYNYKETH